MSSPAIAIQLEPMRRSLRAGETLRGRCRWYADAPDDVKRVELSVLWRTEGKGDEDFGVHYFERLELEDDVTRPAWQLFTTTLPDSPLSYDGPLVKIRWCVRVRLFLAHGKEVTSEKVFQLGNVPAPRERAADAITKSELSKSPEPATQGEF